MQIFVMFSSPHHINNAAARNCLSALSLFAYCKYAERVSFAERRLISILCGGANENRKSKQLYSPYKHLGWLSASILHTGALFQAEHIREILQPLNALKNMYRQPRCLGVYINCGIKLDMLNGCIWIVSSMYRQRKW